MAKRQSHCLACNGFSFDHRQDNNYEYKIFLPGIRSDCRAEPQSQVSVPNVPGLNPKSLNSVYNVKTYGLLIMIRPSVGDVQLGGPLGVF